jgi:hypothetical protein
LYDGQKHRPWKRLGVLLDAVGSWLGNGRLGHRLTLSLRLHHMLSLKLRHSLTRNLRGRS